MLSQPCLAYFRVRKKSLVVIRNDLRKVVFVRLRTCLPPLRTRYANGTSDFAIRNKYTP
jgi:hypothetical protein